MKNLLTLTALLLVSHFVSAQENLNLRKIIQKSDLIIDVSDYTLDTVWVNDFTYKKFIQMDKIDSTNSIVFRNKLSSVPKKLRLRDYVDYEDFYPENLNWECACLGKAHEHGKVYYDLFFIKKEKNEYRVLMYLYGLESEQMENYRHQIETIKSFESIKNEKERFSKTLDWFIENGLFPDSDFIEYYKHKGITTDTIQYSEKQFQNALQQFQNGKEELLPIIKEKYFDEARLYYLQKMEEILKIDKPEYEHYYTFYRAFSAIIGDELDYDSVEYLLYNSLTEDNFELYEKKRIMEHLIEFLKDWEN